MEIEVVFSSESDSSLPSNSSMTLYMGEQIIGSQGDRFGGNDRGLPSVIRSSIFTKHIGVKRCPLRRDLELYQICNNLTILY